MNKKKTLKKQDYSFQNMPSLKLKPNAKVESFKPSIYLKDKKLIAETLWNCLVLNDVEGFKEVLKAHLEVMNKSNLVKETGLSRRTLFRMLSSDGNPTLKNIAPLISKLCA